MSKLFPPLSLPFKHSAVHGLPVPFFITQERLEEISEKHESRPGDVLICTYPKSGTTWMLHIVNLLLDEPQREGEEEQNLLQAVPWINMGPPMLDPDIVDKMESPRIFKSHCKFSWLPDCLTNENVKMITCTRNPKDAAVSYYHHTQFFMHYSEIHGYTFDRFYDEILSAGKSEYGNHAEFLLEWYEQRERSNLLILSFEDMVEDLEREVRKIAEYLEIQLTEEKLTRIVEMCGFTAMKTNDSVNMTTFASANPDKTKSFIRKGKVGNWKGLMRKEQNEFYDKMMSDERFTELELQMRYELE